MSRALDIQRRVWETRVGINEAVFTIEGPKSADYAGSTGRTVNLEDVLRSKNYVEGREFHWEGPYILHMQNDAIDRDVLDHLQIAGARQHPQGD